MPWFFFIVGGLMVLFALFVSPRTWWRTTTAWQHEKPEANEPSDSGFAIRWAALGLAGLALIGLGFWFNRNTSGSWSGQVNARPAVDQVARKLGTSLTATLTPDQASRPTLTLADLQQSLKNGVTQHLGEVNSTDHREAHLHLDGITTTDDRISFTISGADKKTYCLTATRTAPITRDQPIIGTGGKPILTQAETSITTSVTDGAC
ncbi:hypothetical protein [Nocardia blacklockiae]|uniref:hypothetical protein n=1 Tax=Nocardia blacklockiae TaxID=480036 RepID=UPI00189435A7|nr:hypothetical protein [Nocardia blacklockiae]MBF6172727.1 hypothetical protein [Nocardia blacklockiae]